MRKVRRLMAQTDELSLTKSIERASKAPRWRARPLLVTFGIGYLAWNAAATAYAYRVAAAEAEERLVRGGGTPVRVELRLRSYDLHAELMGEGNVQEENVQEVGGVQPGSTKKACGPHSLHLCPFAIHPAQPSRATIPATIRCHKKVGSQPVLPPTPTPLSPSPSRPQPRPRPRHRQGPPTHPNRARIETYTAPC